MTVWRRQIEMLHARRAAIDGDTNGGGAAVDDDDDDDDAMEAELLAAMEANKPKGVDERSDARARADARRDEGQGRRPAHQRAARRRRRR